MADELTDVYTTKLNGKRSLESNNPIPDSPVINHFLYQELADVVILNDPVKGTSLIDLQAGHGFVAPIAPNRGYLNIHYNDTTIPGFIGTRFSQHAVAVVAGDVITITPPLPYDFVGGNEESTKRVNVNMAVVGSVASPIKFITTPPAGQIWSMYRFIVDMILTTLGDDGKFGNLSQLTNGTYYGIESDEYTDYHSPIFDNGDYRSIAYDLEYPIRSGGGGDFGMGCRKTFSRTGSIESIEGGVDEFVKYIQDDLTSGGISRYRFKIGGTIIKARG